MNTRIIRYILLLFLFLSLQLESHVILSTFTLQKQRTQEQPSQHSVGTEKRVSFEVYKDDTKKTTFIRHGILTIKPHARATILICHGFMCDKTDTQFLRTLFEPYNTMLFDFRAHGENTDGQCCSFGRDEAYDVMGAVHFIKSQPELKDLPLIVYGFSMGAAASMRAQALDSSLFTAAIWDCPFDSTENVLARSIDKLKINLFGHEFMLPERMRAFLHKYAYTPYVQSMLKFLLKTVAQMDATHIQTCIGKVNPIEDIKKITIPMLIIGCKKDEKVPAEAIKSIYGNANAYKRLWITNGRRHFDSYFYNPTAYSKKVNAFINSVLNKTYKNKKPEKIKEDVETLEVVS